MEYANGCTRIAPPVLEDEGYFGDLFIIFERRQDVSEEMFFKLEEELKTKCFGTGEIRQKAYSLILNRN